MKKTLLVLFIIMCLFVTGCDKSNNSNNGGGNTSEEVSTTESTTITTTSEVVTTQTTTTQVVKPTTKITTTKKITTKPTTTRTTTTTTRTISEDVTETSSKYGTTITKVVTYTYRVCPNGNKELISKKDKSTNYNFKTFSATTAELLPEARQLAQSNNGAYNEMLGYVNNLRKTEGNGTTLVLDSELSVAATVRALELAWSDTFAHARPSGAKWNTVLSEAGIYGYTIAGENLAGYSNSAQSTFNQWYKSQGHYNNMVDSRFTKIGVGKATVNGLTYWVQLFSN